MADAAVRGTAEVATAAQRCRATFLRHFPGGFRDATYLEWERDYKVDVHRAWRGALAPAKYRALLDAGEHLEIARRSLRVEQGARHSMLFSFEKMALRDALRSPPGARRFAQGLDAFLHGGGRPEDRFDAWRDAVEGLPQRGKRVLTWPVLTVFPFVAQPTKHLFMKPVTMRRAAEAYGWDLPYAARPTWPTYASFLALAKQVKRDLADLGPRDMIDVQSFLWVVGSDEYR